MQPHLPAPKLGNSGSRAAAGSPPGAAQRRHLHGERNLLFRAHRGSQRGVEKRGGQERRGPPGRAARRARPGHAGLPPTRRRRRRRERPWRAAPGGGGRARRTAALLCSAPRRAAPPRLPLARRAHLGSRKRSGVGEGGEEEEGARWGRRAEGGRRALAARPPAPPRRPRGVRRAAAGGREALRGRGQQTPVSLAAADRALPRPAHCGRRVLYNSAVRHRGRDAPDGLGPSAGPATRAGLGVGSREGGPGPAPTLCHGRLGAGAPCPSARGGAGSGVEGSKAAEPGGGATPTHAAQFSGATAKSLRKGPAGGGGLGGGGRIRVGTGRGVRGRARAPLRGRLQLLLAARPAGEGAEGGAARAHGLRHQLAAQRSQASRAGPGAPD